MAASNLEIVREALERYIGGEEEAFMDVLHPDVEWDVTRTFPDFEVVHGKEGVREFFRRWIGTWEDWRIEPLEWIESGDQVIVEMRQSGRGKGSGVEVDLVGFHVYTLRDGRVVRVALFRTLDEARADASLAGEPSEGA